MDGCKSGLLESLSRRLVGYLDYGGVKRLSRLGVLPLPTLTVDLRLARQSDPLAIFPAVQSAVTKHQAARLQG